MIFKISIHAPAKGATKKVAAKKPKQVFQSTLPRRERPRAKSLPWLRAVFQSTLPRRERQKVTNSKGQGSIYFNPRSREGSDITDAESSSLLDISIHAPAKGATGWICLYRAQRRISIHAPAKGATTASPTNKEGIRYFNPRSREGSDQGA